MKDKKQIAIIGGGNAGLHTQVAKLAAENPDLLIVSPEDLKYTQPIEYTPRPRFASLGAEKTKPTCKKHHEYMESGKEEISPNIYRSVWTCRFCGKKL